MAPKPKRTITLAQYEEARDNYTGFCMACGAERDSCEPDARKYECEACGEHEVYGAEEWVIMERITFEVEG
jgi:hypothetical protein